MRDIGCDWVNREAQKEDYHQPKEVLIQANRDFPRRAVAPSLTQMHLLRRMMHTIFSPNAPGMQGGIFSEKDLKKEWVPVWEQFYKDSYYFPYLLAFPETIRALSDLSSLWYREWYLEVTKVSNQRHTQTHAEQRSDLPRSIWAEQRCIATDVLRACLPLPFSLSLSALSAFNSPSPNRCPGCARSSSSILRA